MRAHIDESGDLVFEDPVKHAEWTVHYDGTDVTFSTGEGDNMWMRASDAASVGDWLRRHFSECDWRLGNTDPAKPPSIPIDARVRELEQQLAAVTAARDEACDMAAEYPKFYPRVDELRKVGQ
jgi:hypothetical protein